MKNRTINFNFDLKNLDESKIGNAGEVLGQHIAISSKGDAIKLYGWSQAFHKGEDVSLDASDFKRLREWVEQCETLSILSKGQILSYLDGVEYTKD